MKLRLSALILAVSTSFAFAASDGSENPMVGGAAMFSDKNIVENASAAPNLKTLVAAVKAAGLVETLASPGPFTVFAPTNAAFEKIPAADRAKLMKNKKELAKVLKYHVVGGTWTSTTLMAAIKQGEGFVQLPTLSGHKLKATVQEGKVMLTDEMGNSFYVTNADILATNGLVHIVDGVAHPVQEAIAKQ